MPRHGLGSIVEQSRCRGATRIPIVRLPAVAVACLPRRRQERTQLAAGCGDRSCPRATETKNPEFQEGGAWGIDRVAHGSFARVRPAGATSADGPGPPSARFRACGFSKIPRLVLEQQAIYPASGLRMPSCLNSPRPWPCIQFFPAWPAGSWRAAFRLRAWPYRQGLQRWKISSIRSPRISIRTSRFRLKIRGRSRSPRPGLTAPETPLPGRSHRPLQSNGSPCPMRRTWQRLWN